MKVASAFEGLWKLNHLHKPNLHFDLKEGLETHLADKIGVSWFKETCLNCQKMIVCFMIFKKLTCKKSIPIFVFKKSYLGDKIGASWFKAINSPVDKILVSYKAFKQTHLAMHVSSR